MFIDSAFVLITKNGGKSITNPKLVWFENYWISNNNSIYSGELCPNNPTRIYQPPSDSNKKAQTIP